MTCVFMFLELYPVHREPFSAEHNFSDGFFFYKLLIGHIRFQFLVLYSYKNLFKCVNGDFLELHSTVDVECLKNSVTNGRYSLCHLIADFISPSPCLVEYCWIQ